MSFPNAFWLSEVAVEVGFEAEKGFDMSRTLGLAGERGGSIRREGLLGEVQVAGGGNSRGWNAGADAASRTRGEQPDHVVPGSNVRGWSGFEGGSV